MLRLHRPVETFQHAGLSVGAGSPGSGETAAGGPQDDLIVTVQTRGHAMFPVSLRIARPSLGALGIALRRHFQRPRGAAGRAGRRRGLAESAGNPHPDPADHVRDVELSSSRTSAATRSPTCGPLLRAVFAEIAQARILAAIPLQPPLSASRRQYRSRGWNGKDWQVRIGKWGSGLHRAAPTPRWAAAVAILLASSGLEARPATAATPGAPSLTSVVHTGPGAFTVTWVDWSTNETGFEIRHSAGGRLDFDTVAEVRDHRDGQPGATGKTYRREFTGLSESAVQCFKVFTLVNETRIPSTTPDGLCGASAVPTRPSLTVTHADGSAGVAVRWTASLREEFYNVYYRTSATAPWILQVRQDAWGDANYSRASHAPESATYCYRVDAINAVGTARSNEVCLTGGPWPQAPASLDATVAPRAVTLSFTDRTTIEDSYELWRLVEGGSQAVNVKTWGRLSGTTTFVDNGVSPENTYTYTLVARNVSGRHRVATTVTTPSDRGVRQLNVFNCHSNQRAVQMWTLNLSSGGTWVDRGRLNQQWSNGGCPATGQPFVFTPTSGQLFLVVAVDFSRPGCINDPTLGACRRTEITLEGNANGSVVSATVS
jgi:hypothetical protein